MSREHVPVSDSAIQHETVLRRIFRSTGTFSWEPLANSHEKVSIQDAPSCFGPWRVTDFLYVAHFQREIRHQFGDPSAWNAKPIGSRETALSSRKISFF